MMDARAYEKLRRLLAGAMPFPDRGMVWLVDTGLDFLVREALADCGPERLRVVERDLLDARRLRGALPELAVEHAPRAEPAEGDTVILPAGKQRLALFLDLAHLASRVGPEGRLVLYGGAKEGIGPAQALLERHCSIEDLVIRAGRRLLVCRPGEGDTWDLDRPADRYRAELRGQSLAVATHPGLFSWEGLDPATALLLDTCQPRAGDRLLDLGCGTGVVAAVLLVEGLVTEATLCDSDALALETSRRTLDLNGLNATTVACDAGAELPGGAFDLILTNPPLHRGFSLDRQTPPRIIAEAVRLLAPKGRLHLVGPPNLRLANMLEERFKRVEVLAVRPAFQVWRASRPKSPRGRPA